MGCCAGQHKLQQNKQIEKQLIQQPQLQNIKQNEELQLTQDMKSQSQSSLERKKQQSQTQNYDGQKDYQEAKNAVIINKGEKNIEDLKIILGAFSKIQIFTNLSDEDRETVIKEMNHYTLKDGEIVFEQGQLATNFFVLITGILQVLVNNKQVGTINPGEGFGEVALLHEIPRTATIKVVVTSTL